MSDQIPPSSPESPESTEVSEARATDNRRIAIIAAIVVLAIAAVVAWQLGLFDRDQPAAPASSSPTGTATMTASPSTTASVETTPSATAPTSATAAPTASPTASPTAATSATTASASPSSSASEVTTERTITAPQLAFANPSGTMGCVIGWGNDPGVVCNLFTAPTWAAEAPMCDSTTTGDKLQWKYEWGDVYLNRETLSLNCNAQGKFAELALGSPYTSWFDPAQDGTVKIDVGGTQTEMPVLAEGALATNGTVSCLMEPGSVVRCDGVESPVSFELGTSRIKLTR